MKKLFTFLSRAHNNSVGINSNYRRVSSIYSMLTIVAVLLMVPSAVRGAVYNFDWHYWSNGATGAYLHDSGVDTECSGTIVLSGNDYADIEGAQTVTRVQCRLPRNGGGWSTSKWEVGERLAFVLNTDGKGNGFNGNNGWYLRAEPNPNQAGKYIHAGLYTGCWNSKLAILSLRGGDKVTFTFEAGDNASQYGAGIHYNQSVHCHRGDNNDIYNNQNVYFESGQTIYITSSGDLIIDANIGTYITGIKIESEDVAKYKITTSGNTSTFEFTGNGVLDDNDFSFPYLSFSMGSTDDYLKVENLEAYMIKPNGTETLETNAADSQPSAGSFYAFKPTANGTITVYGTLSGDEIHIFDYKNGWQNCPGWPTFYKETYTTNSFSFNVESGHTYYLCIDNIDTGEHGWAYHLTKFTFQNSFYLESLGKIVDLEEETGEYIELTKVHGVSEYNLTVKRHSKNINIASLQPTIINEYLYIKQPEFTEGTDNAGTVILDLHSNAGDAAFVVTFPYHADYSPAGYVDPTAPDRTYGHTWNFIDPRNSDSNIGNCKIKNEFGTYNDGNLSGILSIGQYKDYNSQFRKETDNREWVYAQRQTGSSGGFHDPMYKNVFDMVGDNADMIWETEGLWFETGPNLSCLYNENDAVDQSLTNPLDFKSPGSADPDRYVGLMPPVQDTDFSSFKIPGLKDGDRVLIFMKSGEGSGANGIFLNITGAKDALGKQINSAYKAGGTNWQHSRYEGCYHFIKDGDGDMKFTLTGGSMAKLLYIRIYQGQRINTNSIVSTGNKQDENGDDVYEYNEDTGKDELVQDAGRILFMNDKGAAKGQYSNMSLRFRGKGQNQKAEVLTSSGNLNYSLADNNAATDSHFTISGKYNQAVGFTSQVGEIGVFRMREMDVEYSENYVADFSDRNFTVGYRDKVDSYPYTWDFTDINIHSSEAMGDEADNYPISAAAQDEYGKANDDGISPWDISLFDTNGNMKLNTGFDPLTDNEIFAPHKIGNGNQLWAGSGVIPEARGLWFYSEDDDDSDYTSDYSSSLYNDCLQITTDGIRFANTPDANGKRVAWWNYKMVVPDVPKDGAVYMRMKRDTSVPDDAVTYSEKDNADVPFLAARFKFASQGSKTDMVTGGEITNGESYSFFQVPGSTTDEWIVAVKNTTGAVNHLTFTLNGWIVKKVAVSTDAKTVNVKGYATESRDHDIDTRLTSYLTGKDIKTYLVGSPNYKNRTLTLTEVSQPDQDNYKGFVLPGKKAVMQGNEVIAPAEGTGCVLYNSTEMTETVNNETVTTQEVKILNGGFHLFVPDMHDRGNKVSAANLSNNMLKANLDATSIPATETVDGTDYTNYILTYKYYKLDKDGKKIAGTLNTDGPEIFYRVAYGGATGKTNTAYLPLPTASVDPSLVTNVQNPAKFTFIFADDLFGQSQGITTAVENIDVQKQIMNGSAEWYNLNGQKLNGKPSKGGLYIINGKKVLVK